jgi:RNA polymerase sigma-70 factor (ECF subfamily)
MSGKNAMNGGGGDMPEIEMPDPLRDALSAAWHRYVDALVPVRPALHAYCRRLSGNLWDAEDLVQDTLVRAFAPWGVTYPAIRDARAYLLRIATNVWIDTLRRRETESRGRPLLADVEPTTGGDPAAASDVRDAGARLLQRLAPQERAAVLLKEVFDMTLDEIATLLATTTGAVKAALHRGRGRLREDDDVAAHRPLPSPALLDRFIERYNARDVPGLVALMLEGGTAENVGNSLHVGRDAGAAGTPHFLHKLVHGHAEWPPQTWPDAVRLERGEYDGEPIVLLFATRWGSEALEVAFRFEEHGGQIARLRAYGFCPETMSALGEALGLPVRTGLYRAPTPAPGASWPEPE